MYEYRTQVPINGVVQRLQTLEHLRGGFLKAFRKKIVITPRDGGAFDYDIFTLRRGRSVHFTSVHAIGTLTFDAATMQTVVRGHLKVDTFYLSFFVLCGLGGLAYALREAGRSSGGLQLPAILVIVALLAWGAVTMWMDWHDLARAIEAAVIGSTTAGDA